MLSHFIRFVSRTKVSGHGLRSVPGQMLTALFLTCLAGTAFAADDEWIELKTPHFTIASEASENRTRDWAVEFELFRRGMSQLIPIDERCLSPVDIVLFRSERRMQPYMRIDKGQPMKLPGYSVRRHGRTTLVISIEGARDDVRDLVYPAGLHWHLSAAERALPAWLEVGLSEVFTTFVLHGDSFDIGANPQLAYRHVRVTGPLPFADLVNLDGDAPIFFNGDRDRRRRVMAQCWVTAHALLFSKEGIGWKAFAEYMSHPAAAPRPTEDLAQTLGLDAAALDRRLTAYLERGESKPFNTTFDRTDIQAGFAAKKLEPWEVDLVLGTVLIGSDRLDDAEGRLSRAMLAAPQDARVREQLAALSLAKEDYSEAERQTRQAMEYGRRTFHNYYILAECGLREAAASSGFGGGDTGDATVNAVKCLELNPRCLPAYEALGMLAPTFDEASARAEELLLAAGTKYGGSFNIQLGCAFVYARRGDATKAKAYLATAKSLAGDVESRKSKTVENATEQIDQRLKRAADSVAK